jgi:hypothetical protein
MRNEGNKIYTREIKGRTEKIIRFFKDIREYL